MELIEILKVLIATILGLLGLTMLRAGIHFLIESKESYELNGKIIESRRRRHWGIESNKLLVWFEESVKPYRKLFDSLFSLCFSFLFFLSIYWIFTKPEYGYILGFALLLFTMFLCIRFDVLYTHNNVITGWNSIRVNRYKNMTFHRLKICLKKSAVPIRCMEMLCVFASSQLATF